MAILTCALAALLIIAGFGALAMSVDLIPTEVGLFYGVSGVMLLGCGAIVLALAALIARLDRIVAPKPAFAAADPVIEPPGPHEVGRYVVRGTEYAIYSDGAIEAETPEGRLRFSSMQEFRAYVEAKGEAAEAN